MIRIPDVVLPTPVAAVAARLPKRPPAIVLTLALNLAVGRGILSADELAPLLDRRLRITVPDAGIVAEIVWDGVRFVAPVRPPDRSRRAPAVPGGCEDSPSLVFTAPACAFLQMLTRQEDPDTLFFSRRLMIEGDTELGLFVKNLLDRIELPRWMTSGSGHGEGGRAFGR